MESYNELKEIHIKNSICSCFDAIINISDLDLDNTLSDEKLYEHILVFDVAYKTQRCKVFTYYI